MLKLESIKRYQDRSDGAPLTKQFPRCSLSLRTRVCHPNTRTYVRLLGPCFKTGRLRPFRQSASSGCLQQPEHSASTASHVSQSAPRALHAVQQPHPHRSIKPTTTTAHLSRAYPQPQTSLTRRPDYTRQMTRASSRPDSNHWPQSFPF